MIKRLKNVQEFHCIVLCTCLNGKKVKQNLNKTKNLNMGEL